MGNTGSTEQSGGEHRPPKIKEKDLSAGKFKGVPHLMDRDFEYQPGQLLQIRKVGRGKRMGFVALYADWCYYCKLLSPTWLEYSKEFKGRSFQFYAIQVSDGNRQSPNPRIAEALGIRSFPTIAFIHEDGRIEALPGFDRSPEGIRKFLKEKKLIS